MRKLIRYIIKQYHVLRYGYILPTDIDGLTLWWDLSDPKYYDVDDDCRIIEIRDRSGAGIWKVNNNVVDVGIVYDRPLNETERQQVEDYINKT